MAREDAYKRPISVSVRSDILVNFDRVLRDDEPRSAAIETLMWDEVLRRTGHGDAGHD